MHRSIAKLEAFYETDTHFYIVMEFAEGEDLEEKLEENNPSALPPGRPDSSDEVLGCSAERRSRIRRPRRRTAR